MREIYNVIIATLLMTALFTLLIYYIIPMPPEYALIAAFTSTVICVMFHELFHKLYAVEFCNRKAGFTLTNFAVTITLFSIFTLSVLILIKDYTGWFTYFIPVVASPGGVYVAMRKADRCYDEIAIIAPLYNFVVGILSLLILFQWTSPPFILNDTSNFAVSLIAVVSFFSFSLAFINALPIKIGDVATDGYWALTIDRRDLFTKITPAIIVVVSFYVLFLTRWWVVLL